MFGTADFNLKLYFCQNLTKAKIFEIMKKVLLFLVAGLLSFTLSSQNVMEKGDVIFNLGLGGPYNYGYIPTINFSGEVGVIPTGDVGIVSFGGIAEFQIAQYTYGWLDENKSHPIFIIGPRAAWHLQTFQSSEWDVYAGVGFGLRISGDYKKNDDDNVYDPKVGPYGEIFFGARYMMSDKFGIFMEVGGYTLSFFKGGISFGI